MIMLQPPSGQDLVCPHCQSSSPEIKAVFWGGIFVIAHTHCHACSHQHWQSLPIGHARVYPYAASLTTNQLIAPTPAKWFTEAFFKAYQAGFDSSSVSVEWIKHDSCQQVILLNCLDYLYGHALLKLFNAHTLLQNHPDWGLVVIVQPALQWLVPEGISEIWVVNLPWRSLPQRLFADLDAQIQQQLTRFDKFALSEAYAHPRPESVDIAAYTRTPRFDLAKFTTSPLQICLIWRNDRLWLPHPFWRFCDLLSKKIALFSFLQKSLLQLQKRKFARLANLLKRQLPEAQIIVVGLSEPVGFASPIVDYCHPKPDEQTERYWCQLYARSQVVVGVHGSNMLLPSALAAAVVELLPDDRIGNLSQDVLMHYPAKLQDYLCRYLPWQVSVRYVARQITALVQGFERYYTHHQVQQPQ